VYLNTLYANIISCKVAIESIILFNSVITVCRFVSISDSLPKTTSIKLVEVWMLISLMQTFADVILQTCIKYSINLLEKNKRKIEGKAEKKLASPW